MGNYLLSFFYQKNKINEENKKENKNDNNANIIEDVNANIIEDLNDYNNKKNSNDNIAYKNINANILEDLNNYNDNFDSRGLKFTVDSSLDSYYINEGSRLFNLREWDKALEFFFTSLEKNLYTNNANYNIANCYSMKKDYEEALKFYDKVLKINPVDIEALEEKITMLMCLKRYEEVIISSDGILKRILFKQNKIVKDLFYFAYNKFESLLILKRFQEAIDLADKIIEYKKWDSGAYNYKARALEALGQKEEADKCFDLMRIYKKSLEFFNEANKKMKQLEYLKAIEIYEKAVSNTKDFSSAYTNIGNCYKNLNKINRCLEYLDIALFYNSTDIETYLNKIGCFFILNKFKEIIELCTIALDLDNDMCSKKEFIYHYMAEAYFYLSEWDEAYNYYVKLYELNMDYVNLWKIFALEKSGKVSKKIIEENKLKRKIIDEKFEKMVLKELKMNENDLGKRKDKRNRRKKKKN